MDATQTHVNNATTHTPLSQTTPLHQYATPTAQVVYTQPQPVATTPVKYTTPASTVASKAASAGMFGFIVVGTGTMGANLHKVSSGEMTLGQAVGNSVVNGVTGGVAAASATAATATLTNGGVAGLAVTLAAATGVSYLVNHLTK